MTTFRSWVAVGWAALLVSSLVSILAVFSGSTSRDLQGLLAVQEALLPVSLLAIGGYVLRARRFAGGSGGAALLWRRTPAWLVFVIACAASLTLIAELTFFLLIAHDVAARPFSEHVPALSALSSAVALAAAVADLRLSAP